MYTDEDLNFGIKKGVFTQDSVDHFRELVVERNHSPIVDEENFRLISGFNDIFVVIAACLLLFSSIWVIKDVNEGVAYFFSALLSWGMAEYFVLRRRLALPAIVLLGTFTSGIFVGALSFLPEDAAISISVAALITVAATYLHWKRFKVPITVAAGTAAAVTAIVAILLDSFPLLEDWWECIIFICGITCFLYAMYWDSSDIKRNTRRSDVAFWLHLLAAPLMIHPVFSSLDVFSGQASLDTMAIVIVLYALLTLLSIAIDRRAFMVSSLFYVVYAISNLIENYGLIDYAFAITGVFIGASLLLLAAFWHPVRIWMVQLLPLAFRQYLPATDH